MEQWLFFYKTMKPKEERIIEILQTIQNQGIGKLVLDIKDDNNFFIIAEYHISNPSSKDRQDAEDAVDGYGFGSYSMNEVGGVPLLIRVKKYKL